MKNIIKRLFHGVVIGHPLPLHISENNIQKHLGDEFCCGCGYKFKIINGEVFDYTLEKIK